MTNWTLVVDFSTLSFLVGILIGMVVGVNLYISGHSKQTK